MLGTPELLLPNKQSGTGVIIKFYGDPRFAISLERAMDASGSPGVATSPGTWAVITQQPPGTAQYVDILPKTNIAYWYRARFVSTSYNPGPYTTPVTTAAVELYTGGMVYSKLAATGVATPTDPTLRVAPVTITGTPNNQQLADGTAAVLVNTVPTPSGSAGSAPAAAPAATLMYQAVAVDMSGTTLPAGCLYVLDYSTNGGAYTSGAILSTSAVVLHTNLNTANTYAYKYKIRGSSDTAYSPATSALTPGARAEIAAFGTVLASQLAVQKLSAISADLGSITAGIMANAGGTAGILLSTGYALPGGWTTYLNLTATGANPILYHAGLSLNADGTAIFAGGINTYYLYSISTGYSAFMMMHKTLLAHGMTDIAPTDAAGFLTTSQGTQGGVALFGLVSGSADPAVMLVGMATTPGTVVGAWGVAGINVWKKNGTNVQALAAGEVAFTVGNGGNPMFTLFANGALTLGQALTIQAGGMSVTGTSALAAITCSGGLTISASGMAVTGTITLTGPIIAATSGNLLDTGTVNDKALSGLYTQYKWGGGSNVTYTGFVAGTDGQLLIISGAQGAYSCTLAHENTGSVAANRLQLTGGANLTLSASRPAVLLMYNGTTQRWQML